jgi:hypothetical protein
VSGDRHAEADVFVDLERPLVQLPDQHFDVLTALDVLEHVEHFHSAFSELLRITRALAIVALPNMASYYHRLSFLCRGRLGTDKYDLPSKPVSDRHRWLTAAKDVVRVMPVLAAEHGFDTDVIVYELEGKAAIRIALYPIARLVPLLRNVLCTRVLFMLHRRI